jgi:hypothetical protein
MGVSDGGLAIGWVKTEQLLFEHWVLTQRHAVVAKSASGEYLTKQTRSEWDAWWARALIAARETKKS